MSLSVQPGVTIVIPAYNYAEFVEQALESALRQTYPHLEILVVDDGSTDGTPTILERYADRVRVVTQDNLGLSAARNRGLREAKHDLVVFLDADDLLHPSMVMLLSGTLSVCGDNCALVAGCHRYIDVSGRPLEKRVLTPAETADVTRADLLVRSHFSPSAVLVRRRFLLAMGGFNEELARVEDRDMWLRLAERFRLVQIPDVIADVRLHFRNMSKDADLMCQCLREVLGAALARLPVPPALDRLCWGSYYHECAWMEHESGHRREAVWNELRSLAASPGPRLRRELGGPVAFRLRALARFLLGLRESSAERPAE